MVPMTAAGRVSTFISGEPDHLNSLLFQPVGSPLIAFRLFGMNRSIDLDTEPQRGAVEVENIWTNGVLTSKMPTQAIASKQKP
jgi:hypothetical protein